MGTMRAGGLQVEAVLTTGIYCRAECSARPLARNVTQYSNPAAAEAAGFRPCLRCRPERRAGSLAELEVPAPVEAALIHINDGFLDHEHEDALADQVGYSTRQLRRLFERHVGATPAAIARSRRAHFARCLIDDTDLTFTEIARAAGFGGPRQLHRAMTSVFRFTPSELRAKRRTGTLDKLNGGLVLAVPYVAPFNFEAFVAHQSARVIPGVEAATVEPGTGSSYVRSFNACGHPGVAELCMPADGACADDHLQLRLHLPTYGSIIDVVSRCRTMLGVNENPAPAQAALANDPLIGGVVRNAPGLRVHRSWDRFETAIRIVVGQQISLAAASTMCGRIAQRFGTHIAISREPIAQKPSDQHRQAVTHLFPSAASLADASVGGLVELGFTRRRSETILGLSTAIANGEVNLSATESLEHPDSLANIVARLCELRGIGPWTAHLIAMRIYGHHDAFPASDLGLRRAVERLVGHHVNAAEMEALAEPWRPYRSWAAQHLWHAPAPEKQAPKPTKLKGRRGATSSNARWQPRPKNNK